MALGLKYKNEESILEEAGTVTPFWSFRFLKIRELSDMDSLQDLEA